MSDYTPTTEQVKAFYAPKQHSRHGQHSEAFDRWLAEEIRKAKADALNEAADACWEGYEHTDNRGVSIWLRNRAQQLTEES